MLSRQQLEGETESLRDQLLEAQDTSAQLTSQVTELQDKWEECSVLLKEAQVSLWKHRVFSHVYTYKGYLYIPHRMRSRH